jgi:hypothetical protein
MKKKRRDSVMGLLDWSAGRLHGSTAAYSDGMDSGSRGDIHLASRIVHLNYVILLL